MVFFKKLSYFVTLTNINIALLTPNLSYAINNCNYELENSKFQQLISQNINKINNIEKKIKLNEINNKEILITHSGYNRIVVMQNARVNYLEKLSLKKVYKEKLCQELITNFIPEAKNMSFRITNLESKL